MPDLTADECRPPEFIIEGIIPVGLTFLAGAPKIRKSFFVLQAAISVATGNPFMGHQTTKCKVAYLDLEGSKSRISSRTSRMTTQIPRDVLITNSIPSRLADSLVEDIRAMSQRDPNLRFFIIDTYSRARGNVKGSSANAYDQDVALLEPVQRMAVEANIAVLFVHHDKKGAGMAMDSFERLSGTMGISGSADCVLNLVAEGKRFDGKATLEYNPRDAKGGEIKLEFDQRTGEWLEVVEAKSDLRGNPLCAWIIDNAPEPKKNAKKFSYESICAGAYHGYRENPGSIVREQLGPRRMQLIEEHGIAVQMGVTSDGERGIRVINLK